MKLKTKDDVIEYYWIDFLVYCRKQKGCAILPTINNFWQWYINDDGPLGTRTRNLFYMKIEQPYA